ncbi:hypothetical protein OH77DRAFT_1058945 [Trametes cingulata]|nr:hypothetical protein OH77DRAFT_1058945 [Trametes cingulata]
MGDDRTQMYDITVARATVRMRSTSPAHQMIFRVSDYFLRTGKYPADFYYSTLWRLAAMVMWRTLLIVLHTATGTILVFARIALSSFHFVTRAQQ